MQKTCANPWCRQPFEITDDDLRFYEKVSPVFHGKKELIPSPTQCPECRQARRMVYRCERSFYIRSCDHCQNKIISMHHAQAPLPVFCSECWWGSAWDGMQYGATWNARQSFFEQWGSLRRNIPALSMVISHGENSDYSNYGSRLKNCYLLIAGDQAVDCFYGSYVWLSRDCVDCMNVIKCEQCYECIECERCYHCMYSQKLESCTDCLFGYDLRSCRNCFGCVGLRNKHYCYFNEQLSKEEYEKRIAALRLTRSAVRNWLAEREPLRLQHPHKYAQLTNCDHCSGDSLSNAHHAYCCFDSFDLEHCKFIVNGPEKIKDCYDFSGITTSELSYEGSSILGAMRLLFSERCWNSTYDILYCSLCMRCSNCFGCI